MSKRKVKADLPEKLKPLFKPSRYKVLYGGRGGGKSWGVARALLILGAKKPLRILCARELQKSIKDSVHRLLSDQIKDLGLDQFYTIQQTTIKGCNGTEFFFEGLRHNANQIKSYEGADICWIEEAVTVSKSSWDFLIPTIRKEGSEIWLTFNPELEEDETYQRFVLGPPPDAIVIKINHNDNPWFTDVLSKEMEHLREKNYQDYLNVWEGHPRQTVEGAIYMDEMRAAFDEGRITNVPYDPTIPVDTAWDLGYSDMTSIWFIQKSGFEYHIIDFYQDYHKLIAHYVEVLQEKSYVYGTDYLPHDGRSNQLAGVSIEKTLKGLGREVVIVPRKEVIHGIDAARSVFPACWFDKRKCADGLQALRRYRYDVNMDTGRMSKNPLHDENSHAADAFRCFAMGYKERTTSRTPQHRPRRTKHGWMGA